VDSLSLQLFVMCLLPLSLVLRGLNKGFKVDDMVISHLLYVGKSATLSRVK